MSYLKTFSTSSSDCLKDLKAAGLTAAEIDNYASTVRMVNALTHPAVAAGMPPRIDFSPLEGAPVPSLAYNPLYYWQTSFAQLLGTLVHEYVHLQNPKQLDTQLQAALGLTVNSRDTSNISRKFATDCFAGIKDPKP